MGIKSPNMERVNVIPDCLGYEKWDNTCLVKFSEFLGVSTVGYENEILCLMRKMVNQQTRDKSKGIMSETKCERKLRKLECIINYDGQDCNRGGGGRDKRNMLLKLK